MYSLTQGRCMIPWIQVVIGYTGRIWGKTADESPPKNVMGEADNGGPVREVLRRPFHGHYRGDAGRPSHVHHIQYCGRRGHTPLG